MADIPLQQRSGVEDVSRTIVPLPSMTQALGEASAVAGNIYEATTRDFEAQQMEKVKRKTIAAQNALNLIAQENRRKGIEPLRAQAVVGGDTFANRQFLKTAQELSRSMTINQVETDLQSELNDLHIKYLTSDGQLDYDPAHPEKDRAAWFEASAFAILKKYQDNYAGSPFVDEAFSPEMTAKFTENVNAKVKTIREVQANKVVERYQTQQLMGLQTAMAKAYDKSLAYGFAHADDFDSAHKSLVEPLVKQMQQYMYNLDASGADSGTMRNALLAAHDALTEQFKNGVFQELLSLPANDAKELADKNTKIAKFVDYINRGGAFYENQMLRMPEDDGFDPSGQLEKSIDNLYKLNIVQGKEAYNQEFPSEEAFVATFNALIPFVKNPEKAKTLREKFNTTLVELDVSRKRMAGDKIGRKSAIDKMLYEAPDGSKPGEYYASWRDEIKKLDDGLVPDRSDPISIAVLDPQNGDHIISKAHQTIMTRVANEYARGNPVIEQIAEQVNQQRVAQGLKPYDLNTEQGVTDFSRDVADENIGAYSAQIAEQNVNRALNEWKDDPSVVFHNSRMPKATYEAASRDLYAAAKQPDKSSFLRQAEIVTNVFVNTNGEFALDSDFEKLDGEVKAGDVGVGTVLKVSSNARLVADGTAMAFRTWWAAAESGSVDQETAAMLKTTQTANVIKDYSGELEALGAGKVGSQQQYDFVNKMLQGAAYDRLQGVSGGGLVGDAQREVVSPEALTEYSERVLRFELEKVRTGTALTENKGYGGRVVKLPPFVQNSQADLKVLSYVTSTIDEEGRTQMVRDLGAAYEHMNLSGYEPVVVDNKIRFRNPRSSPYEPTYLLWMPNGTPTATDKFTQPGAKLKLIQPVTGQPVEFSLQGFADEINDARRAESADQQEAWKRMQLLLEFPSDTLTTERR